MIELLTNNCNLKTTQESTYIKEHTPEINDIVELLEVIFLPNKKTTNQNQRKDPSLLTKHKKVRTKPVLIAEEGIRILPL